MDGNTYNTNDTQTVSETYENNQGHLGNASESEARDSETFPNNENAVSETFRKVPSLSERTAEHTLSVRDTAKIFESAHVPLRERTVINWCKPNKHGIKRLTRLFDEHDGKYFIAPHSVDKALREEADKHAHASSIYAKFSERFGNTQETFPQHSERLPKNYGHVSETFGSVREEAEPTEYHEPIQQHVEKRYEGEEDGGVDEKRLKGLEQEVLELKILNKGKDYFIDQLKAGATCLPAHSKGERNRGALDKAIATRSPTRQGHHWYGRGEGRQKDMPCAFLYRKVLWRNMSDTNQWTAITKLGERYYVKKRKEKLEKKHMGEYAVIERRGERIHRTDADRLVAVEKASRDFGDKLFYIAQVGSVPSSINFIAQKYAWNL
jgi:hypothetical protein